MITIKHILTDHCNNCPYFNLNVDTNTIITPPGTANKFLVKLSCKNYYICNYTQQSERSKIEHIVYCKDCKSRRRRDIDGRVTYYCGDEETGMASGVELADSDFCSYGKEWEND